jgi:hypothetical protein
VETQFTFAEVAVREGLPKSAIESLVAGYNDAVLLLTLYEREMTILSDRRKRPYMAE